jgi:hypothetical protein
MRLRRVAPLAVSAWLACVAFVGPSSAAGGNTAVVVPRNAVVGGLTYAQWEAKAWQWELAHVRYYSSTAPEPKVPRCTTAGQHGPMWFLHGDLYNGAGNAITRSCDIPAGKYLFFDQPTDECSTVEAPPFHATTDAGLLRCARSFGRPFSTLTLDGRPVKPSGFVVATSVFRFTMPPHNNYLLVPGATRGRGAAWGQALMLRPLSKGRHTLVRRQGAPGVPLGHSTYHLTIG